LSRPKNGVRIKIIKTEYKIYLLGGLVTFLIIGIGVWFVSQENQRLEKPLVGQEVQIESRNHVPEGTSIQYNTNPPAGGPHYPVTAHAGVYDKAPADGYLVHSLEHGTVILWYREDLAKGEVEKLKGIFNKMGGKTIMTPRKGMDVPVGVTSWGRILKLKEIDEKKILEFYETNYNRAPEQAPI